MSSNARVGALDDDSETVDRAKKNKDRGCRANGNAAVTKILI
jgi:hypothetical protein